MSHKYFVVLVGCRNVVIIASAMMEMGVDLFLGKLADS